VDKLSDTVAGILFLSEVTLSDQEMPASSRVTQHQHREISLTISRQLDKWLANGVPHRSIEAVYWRDLRDDTGGSF